MDIEQQCSDIAHTKRTTPCSGIDDCVRMTGIVAAIALFGNDGLAVRILSRQGR